MKVLLTLTAATAVLFTTAVAQDAPKPQFRANEAAPKSTEAAPKESTPKSVTLEPGTAEPAPKEPLGLIPETFEPAPKPKGTALMDPLEAAVEQKIDKTTAAQDELNARIKMRELKTKADRDPKVAAELERANTAATDYEKREALRSYYTLLYDKIAKIDPTLKKRAIEARVRMTHRLDQTRIAPTEPIQTDER